jgi:hypothetical protein
LTFFICNLSFASDYLLAPTDQLEIKIIGQSDLDTKQAIAPDGSISLPLIGRISAGGKTLAELDKELDTKFAKFLRNPQVAVFLTPRPIYVVQHNLKDNTWQVMSAKSTEEARALAGPDYAGDVQYGLTIYVDTQKTPDWWETNWYKVITAAAVVIGAYVTIK